MLVNSIMAHFQRDLSGAWIHQPWMVSCVNFENIMHKSTEHNISTAYIIKLLTNKDIS